MSAKNKSLSERFVAGHEGELHLRHTYIANRVLAGVLILLAVVTGFLFSPLAVHGATQFTVNTTADGFDGNLGDGICATPAGNCTLRAALQQANATGGAVTIILPAGTYALTLDGATSHNITPDSRSLEVGTSVTINGAGQGVTKIVGPTSGSPDRVFNVEKFKNTFTFTLTDITITGGTAPTTGMTPGLGGGLLVGSSIAVSMTDVTITGNSASGSNGFGGAIYNYGDGQINGAGGTVLCTRCTIRNNSATQGGAILNGYPASMVLNQSIISDNQALGPYAGAIRNTGTLSIGGNSSIDRNRAGTNTPAPTALGGGAIYNGDPPTPGAIATLTVADTTFSGNTLPMGQVSNGGAIWNETGGVANLTRVTIAKSSAYQGGAILNDQSTMTLIDSVLMANTAFYGGAVYNNTFNPQPTARTFMTFYRTTIWGNVATTVNCPTNLAVGTVCGAGGGIFAENSTTNVSDSTISGNFAQTQGGGVYNLRFNNGLAANADFTATNATIANNSVATNGEAFGNNGGGGVWNNTGVTTYKNTIVSDNVNTATNHPSDCYMQPGSITTSNGNNLDGDNSCGFGLPSDQHGNPLLGPLKDNGGPTPTHALLAGSPAIDKGDNATCAGATVGGVDQRGIARPQGPSCDVGAVEYTPAVGAVPVSQRPPPPGLPPGNPQPLPPVARPVAPPGNTAPNPVPFPRR